MTLKKLLVLAMLVSISCLSVQTSEACAKTQTNVQEIIDLAKQGDKMKKNLIELDGAIEDSQLQLKKSRQDFKKSKQDLKAITNNLLVQQKNFAKQKLALQNQTLEYINLANSFGGKVLDGDQNVLAYVADANSQDAVLVYETTRSLLNTKKNKLDSLRLEAEKTAALQQNVQTKVEIQNRLTQQKETSILQTKVSLKELRQSSVKAEKEYKLYKKIEKRYAKRFFKETGEKSSLNNNSFSDGLQADKNIEGKIKWPLSGSVSSNFSNNRCLNGTCRAHEGIDIAASTGTPVHASAAGKVSFAGVQSGYGNFVCIKHNQSTQTCYAHLSSIGVKNGQNVAQNKTIAKSGCTGRCFGPHLHYEIRIDNKAVNPLKYLPKKQ